MRAFLQRMLFRLVMLFKKQSLTNRFLAALSELLEKRVCLPEALETLAALFPLLAKRLRLAAEALRNGATLTDCCVGQLKFLPQATRRILSTGEQQGLLTEFISLHLSIHSLKMTAAQWSAALTLFIFWLTISTILVFVIPTFSKMFADMGSDLPLFTRMVILCSEIFVNNLLLIVASICLLVYLVTRTGMYRLLLPLHHQYARIMASTTTLLLQHGKLLPDTIRVSAALTGNKAIAAGAEAMIGQMHNGSEPLAAIMAEQRLPRDYRLYLATLLTPEGTATPGSVLLECLTERLDVEQSMFNEKTTYYSCFLISVMVGLLVIAMYLPIFVMARMVSI